MPAVLSINRDECIGCQLCADVIPAVFRMDAKGLAEVHDSNGAPVEHIDKVIESCPKACIAWVES